jgi:hypothetical protein
VAYLMYFLAATSIAGIHTEPIRVGPGGGGRAGTQSRTSKQGPRYRWDDTWRLLTSSKALARHRTRLAAGDPCGATHHLMLVTRS